MNPTFRLKRFSQLPNAGPLSDSDVIPLGRPERDYHASLAEVSERIKLEFKDEILDDLIDELQNMLSNRIGAQMERAIIHTSGTWVAPENLSGGRVRVRMVGGGSSGNRLASSSGLINLTNHGRRGGYVEVWTDVVAGSSYPVIVGAGGVGWPAGETVQTGQAGGDTSFAGFIAYGGPTPDSGEPNFGEGGGSNVGEALGLTVSSARRQSTTSAGGSPLSASPWGADAFHGGGQLTFEGSGYGYAGSPATPVVDGASGGNGLIVIDYLTTYVLED